MSERLFGLFVFVLLVLVAMVVVSLFLLLLLFVVVVVHSVAHSVAHSIVVATPTHGYDHIGGLLRIRLLLMLFMCRTVLATTVLVIWCCRVQ